MPDFQVECTVGGQSLTDARSQTYIHGTHARATVVCLLALHCADGCLTYLEARSVGRSLGKLNPFSYS